MKAILTLILLFSANSAFASTPLQCAAFAEKAAAQEVELPLKQFRAENSLVWSCKFKKDPSLEAFDFSDGSSLVIVETKITNGQCQVTGITVAQDDQDGDSSADAENCL